MFFFPVVCISYCTIFDDLYISVRSYRSVEFVIRRLSLLYRISNRCGCSSRKYDYNHVQAFHLTVAREAINPGLAWTMVFSTGCWFRVVMILSSHYLFVQIVLMSSPANFDLDVCDASVLICTWCDFVIIKLDIASEWIVESSWLR